MKILRIAGIALAPLLLLALGTWLYLRSGRFDVAAEQSQSQLANRWIDQVRERGIARRSHDLHPPSPFDAATVERGALVYVDSCEICHGGPGRQGLPFAYGLHPVPPALDAPAVQDRGDGELYWIITHGLRFTGMPAFQRLYDDDDRWALVAFLRQMPELLPPEYEEMVVSYTEGEAAEDGALPDSPKP
jgi:mono/diheme cytochrome c family protein